MTTEATKASVLRFDSGGEYAPLQLAAMLADEVQSQGLKVMLITHDGLLESVIYKGDQCPVNDVEFFEGGAIVIDNQPTYVNGKAYHPIKTEAINSLIERLQGEVKQITIVE
jgi:hypothetical protein